MDAMLSHVRGADTPPLMEETLGQALDIAVREWGDEIALISPPQEIRWTFRELASRADALAAGLLALGLEPGDRIGIWSPNCAEWALTQFAAAKAGLILVTINPAYRLSEVEYTLNKVGVKALVAAERFKTSDYVGDDRRPGAGGARRRRRAPWRRRGLPIPARADQDRRRQPRPGWLDFADVAERGGAERLRRSWPAIAEIGAGLSSRDAINIQFTSGTTGLPKGATLSHRNILNNGYFVGRAMGLRRGDRVCIPVPLYHCFGMVMGNLACLTHGAAMVYPAPAFDPEATLSAIEAERCTALYGVPTMFIAVLGCPHFDSFDVSSLRTGCMAGSPCPVEVMKQVIDRMHMPDVTIAYGMTETSPVSFQTSLDDPVERRVSTIGRVQPHLEVKIVDENGADHPARRRRRGLHARLLGDAGLLGRSGPYRRVPRHGRLDAHRRSRGHRRRGLRQHRRAHQGHGDPRRREPVSARDRGVPLHASQDRRRPGGGRSRPPVRRGTMRLDPPASR